MLWKTRVEKRRIAPSIPNVSARWGWVFNAKYRPFYAQGRPGTPCRRVLVGVRAGKA